MSTPQSSAVAADINRILVAHSTYIRQVAQIFSDVRPQIEAAASLSDSRLRSLVIEWGAYQKLLPPGDLDTAIRIEAFFRQQLSARGIHNV